MKQCKILKGQHQFSYLNQYKFYLNTIQNQMKRKRRSAYRSQLVKQDTQTSISQPTITEKFKAFNKHQKVKSFQQKLHDYFGKNFVVDYKSSFNFSEEWENKNHRIDSSDEFQNIWKVNRVGAFLTIVIMIVFVLGNWTRNIQAFFADSTQAQNWQWVYILVLIFELPDAYLKLRTGSHQKLSDMDLLDILKIIYDNIYCTAYLLLILLGVNKMGHLLWYILEFVFLGFQFARARQIFGAFRLTEFALRNQHQLKAVNMVITLMLLIHGIALVLFEITKLDFQQNWFASVSLIRDNGLTRYIYSVYFATSTIFTVGYGDISPKNEVQIIVIILIQILGIAIFGFIINQFGFSLAALRKGREEMEKELNLMNKIKKYYKIDQHLMERARSYIINQKKAIENLLPEQQKQILTKFNQELRNQIKSDSSLSIVKSCIFFLCGWSKQMQNAVASRLNSMLLSPCELVYQPEGKERLYIIRLGAIEVHAKRRGSRKKGNSKIKTISNDLSKEVSDNSYGYTAILSRKPVKLEAVAKDHTSVYFIEKQKFKECIGQMVTDSQYYHQMKHKIEQAEQCQVFQVPQLANSKQHYFPCHFQLLRKYKAKKLKGVNKRKDRIRSDRRSQNIYMEHYGEMANIWSFASISNVPSTRAIDQVLQECEEQEQSSYEQNIEIEQTQTEKATLKGNTIERNMKTIKQNCQNYSLLMYIMNNHMNSKKIKEYIQIDQGKEYSNYFPRGNKNQIIRNLQVSLYSVTFKNDAKAIKNVVNHFK